MLIPKPFIRIFSCLFVSFLALIILLPKNILAQDVEKDTQLIHRVSTGESLHKIARKYLPLTEEFTVDDLVEKIKVLSGVDGSLIRPNQWLIIPLVRTSPVAAKTVPKETDFEAKGIYVNRYTMASQRMKRLIAELAEVGGNTVILDGKDMSGKLSYPSRVNLAKEIGADAKPVTRDLAKLINYLHEREIHVGVRLVLFYDQLLAEQRPELALKDGFTGDPLMENGIRAWVDPSHPVVQEYNLGIARELAAMGVDEIQFDYIRFPTKENVEYGESGLYEQTVPRHKVITDFLARARRELAKHQVLLSIDVFGIIAWGKSKDVEMTGQKIEDLAAHCDVISPMIYPSHFHNPFRGIIDPSERPYLLVSQTCKRFSRLLKVSQTTLRPWIQAFPLGTDNFDEEYIFEQLRALDESKVRGWLLWSAGNKYDVAWKALVEWNDDSSGEKNLTYIMQKSSEISE
ncbi:MAG: LysM peptidoglycan-binding domain-containing protein [Deltaproteobacteria bacterium]|nr:MAG: LysM peptidoglycan-binding domain-containing protein [Deltaproteobacteria bacterium]